MLPLRQKSPIGGTDATRRIQTVQTTIMAARRADIMKAMLKSELASAAGVSSQTFRRWLLADTEYLCQQGIKSTTRILPPQVVRYLCEKYDIEL